MRALGLTLVLGLAACANAPPYAHCAQTPCAMGECIQVTYTRSDGHDATGTFCSSACTADADCPDDGACIALGHDPMHTFFCVARCDASRACYAGFACTTVTPDTGAAFGACLPQ
jgi:hypothetical protein